MNSNALSLAPTDPIEPRLSLLAVGAGSTGAQIVLLREVLGSLGGNEILAGMALGTWILLSGAGSLLGGRIAARVQANPAALRLDHLLLAALPFAMLAAMRAWPMAAAIPGSQIGFAAALLGCFATFLPYGLLSGAIVPCLGRRLDGAGAPGTRASAAGRAFTLDSAGCAAGGAALSVLLLAGTPHGWCLAVAGLLHLAAATRGARIAFALGALVLAASAATLDRSTLAWRFPGQRLLESRSSPYGQTTVTRLGSQVNVYRDAIPVYSTGDLSAEARVHPALCQAPEGARVALIGGSVFGAAREALRHRPSRLDCVEQDPALFALTSPRAGAPPLLDDASLDAPVVRRHAGDGRAFLRSRSADYDAILLDLPGPESAGWNRFYTEEFFREARGALRPGGVLAFALVSSPNYLGPEQLALERSIASALRASFPEIEVLTGDLHYFLASDRRIDLGIGAALDARGIATERLLDYDWPELNDPFRRDEVEAQLGLAEDAERAGPAARSPAALRGAGPRAPATVPNRDLAPLAFRHLLEQRARVEGGDRWLWPLFVLSALLLALASRGRARLLAVGTSGGAAMALELAVLLLFQVWFGNLYLWLAAFVTLFLLGAAAGAHLAPRLGRLAGARIWGSDVALILGSLVLILLVRAAVGTGPGASGTLRSVFGRGALPALAFLLALPAGVQFAAAGEGARGASLAHLYWADLAGAAFGTIAAGLILLPRFGMLGVIAAVAAWKTASLLAQGGAALARR